MVTIIYGLGNNDLKFLDTKHNVGRIICDLLVKDFNLDFKKKDSYSWTKLDNKPVYFLRTNGYMNNSGDPLSSFINYFKLNQNPEKINLVVFHDDSDQLETKQKFVNGGRSAGNKGIDSIYKSLPSNNIDLKQVWKLKIGIRPTNNKSKSSTFVLKKIGSNELFHLIKIKDLIIENWKLIEDFQPEKLQNIINGDIK